MVYFLECASRSNPADLFGGSFGFLLEPAMAQRVGTSSINSRTTHGVSNLNADKQTCCARRMPNDPPRKSAGFECGCVPSELGRDVVIVKH
jgi:hypothetical protein